MGMPKAAERFKSVSISFWASREPITKRADGQRCFNAELPPMWSPWPCVLRMAAGRSSSFSSAIDDLLGLEAGIDDEAISATLLADDVSVLLKRYGDDGGDADFGGLHEVISQ